MRFLFAALEGPKRGILRTTGAAVKATDGTRPGQPDTVRTGDGGVGHRDDPRPTRRRRGVGRSVSSGRCTGACRRSWRRRRGGAFVPLRDVDLDNILCLKEERAVTRDHCVSYRGRSLQLPAAHGRHYVMRRDSGMNRGNATVPAPSMIPARACGNRTDHVLAKADNHTRPDTGLGTPGRHAEMWRTSPFRQSSRTPAPRGRPRVQSSTSRTGRARPLYGISQECRMQRRRMVETPVSSDNWRAGAGGLRSQQAP